MYCYLGGEVDIEVSHGVLGVSLGARLHWTR